MFSSKLINQGFSLIEVLIAFTILAIAVTTLLVAFSGGVRNSSLARDYTKAVIIAESQLVQSGIISSITDQETTQGTEDKFHWQKSVKPLISETTHHWQLFEVTVVVRWNAFNGQRSFEISGLKWGRLNG